MSRTVLYSRRFRTWQQRFVCHRRRPRFTRPTPTSPSETWGARKRPHSIPPPHSGVSTLKGYHLSSSTKEHRTPVAFWERHTESTQSSTSLGRCREVCLGPRHDDEHPSRVGGSTRGEPGTVGEGPPPVERWAVYRDRLRPRTPTHPSQSGPTSSTRVPRTLSTRTQTGLLSYGPRPASVGVLRKPSTDSGYSMSRVLVSM